jgi:uncharacterized membrane protein (Fun14 family)
VLVGVAALVVAALVVAALVTIDWISFTKLDKSDILYGRYLVYALGV